MIKNIVNVASSCLRRGRLIKGINSVSLPTLCTGQEPHTLVFPKAKITLEGNRLELSQHVEPAGTVQVKALMKEDSQLLQKEVRTEGGGGEAGEGVRRECALKTSSSWCF